MPRLAISSADGPVITLDGRQVISFGGCNYLGLSYHPDVQEAMIRGLREFGISTSASRETTGNTTAHDRLEEAVRSFLGAEAAVVAPDGYTANLAAAQALSATHEAALIDSRSHRSIREAIVCSGMSFIEFRHLDTEDVAGKIEQVRRSSRGRISIWTDGVFASDGSVAPISQLLEVSARQGATLVVDDCHGLCTMGPEGRGTLSHFAPGAAFPPHAVVTSTLAKGLGCHGGFVASARTLAASVRIRSAAYICTTPTSPAIAAAAIRAFEIASSDPSRVRRLHANAALLRRELRDLGFEIPEHPTPIFAFAETSQHNMRDLQRHLLDRGFLAPLIDYPDGPAPVYFRLSVTSEHTTAQIESFIAAIRAHVDSGSQSRTVGQIAG
jgi:7-keto-8-aminopelargonate synthetase-like enzyme